MRMPRNMLDFNSYLSGLMGGMVEGPQLISSGHLPSRGMLSCGNSGGELCFFLKVKFTSHIPQKYTWNPSSALQL